jgi:hypothetical protein
VDRWLLECSPGMFYFLMKVCYHSNSLRNASRKEEQ